MIHIGFYLRILPAYPKHGTNRLAQPVSALTNWAMSTSTKIWMFITQNLSHWTDRTPQSPLPVHYSILNIVIQTGSLWFTVARNPLKITSQAMYTYRLWESVGVSQVIHWYRSHLTRRDCLIIVVLSKDMIRITVTVAATSPWLCGL